MWYAVKLLPMAVGNSMWQLQPIQNFYNGVPYERLFASSSGCLTLFAEAVSERYSDKQYTGQSWLVMRSSSPGTRF